MPDTLPIHPRTGLPAAGIVAGRPVWPILGGNGETAPPPGSAAAGAPAPPAAGEGGAAPATGTGTGAGAGAAGEQPLGEPGKAALEAERRARRDAERALKTAQDQLKSIEDKDKSELQKATERNSALEQQLAAATADSLRTRVALQHGVAQDDLILLTGSTEEQLTAQAQRIAALRAGQAAATAPPAFAPSPGQQAGNGTPPAPTATVESGRELYRKRHPAKTTA